MRKVSKDKLKGKYVEYRDRNEATRIGKVRRVGPNFLTVKPAIQKKVRVPKERVLCKITRSGRRYAIDWESSQSSRP